jgi:hypothetical protein
MFRLAASEVERDWMCDAPPFSTEFASFKS